MEKGLIMKNPKYIWVVVKFNNTAWGLRSHDNKLSYLETKTFKSWKAVSNELNAFLDQHDYRDFGNQYIDRFSKAVEIIRVLR